METKNLTQEQREFIDTLISTRETIASKKESKGFVVAGNASDNVIAYLKNIGNSQPQESN